MSDIVERMRSYARNCGGPPEDYLTWQAAAEIERLRATNAELVAALQEIASVEPRSYVTEIARVALAKAGGKE